MGRDEEKAREKYVDIVFDGPPSHESGRFIEVENEAGKGIEFGEWLKRDDGYWVLRIREAAALVVRVRELEEQVEAMAQAIEKEDL